MRQFLDDMMPSAGEDEKFSKNPTTGNEKRGFGKKNYLKIFSFPLKQQQGSNKE